MEDDKGIKKILSQVRAYDFRNDPNYSPRVIEIEYERKRDDGSIVKRIKTKNISNPPMPSDIRRVMGLNPILNENLLKKYPRPCNNSPKYHRRRNGKMVWVRPLLKRVLNSMAINLIKEGLKVHLIDIRGLIKKEYKKTQLIPIPFKGADSTYPKGWKVGYSQKPKIRNHES